MNKYATWQGGGDSDISSLFDQIHPRMSTEEGDRNSTPSISGMYVDPRLNIDPLTHLAQAVGDMDIWQDVGREQPPTTHNTLSPPSDNYLSTPRTHLTLTTTSHIIPDPSNRHRPISFLSHTLPPTSSTLTPSNTLHTLRNLTLSPHRHHQLTTQYPNIPDPSISPNPAQ